MDIPRPSAARSKRIRRIIYILVGLVVAATVTVGLSRLKPAAPEVDRSTVWVDTVKRGPMLIQVRGLGTLVPEEILWIPAVTDGRVVKRLLPGGPPVKADTVLVVLRNPQLEQETLDAEWQLKAAQANVRAARAAGMPTVSLAANASYTGSSVSDPFHSQSIGVSLAIPIFTGFNTSYQIRAAQARVDSQAAQRDSVSLQVALDVWQAYQNLSTGIQAVRSSSDLVASAAASERVALGRYKAGAGTILEGA